MENSAWAYETKVTITSFCVCCFYLTVPNLLGLPALAVVLEMLGKFAFTAVSSLMYIYVSELYPTVLRNTATAVCSILSRVGSSIVPFLFKLSE